MLVIGAILTSRPSPPSIDDVPAGLADAAVEATRDELLMTIRLAREEGSDVRVSLCPGLLPGPSDAAGVRERIRGSGCLDAVRDPSGERLTWVVDLAGIDADDATRFDAAERWLVIVTTADGGDGSAGDAAARWVAGGPIFARGPLLP